MFASTVFKFVKFRRVFSTYLFSKVQMLRVFPMTPPNTVILVRMPEIQNFHLDTLNIGACSGAPQVVIIEAEKQIIKNNI